MVYWCWDKDSQILLDNLIQKNKMRQLCTNLIYENGAEEKHTLYLQVYIPGRN